MSRHARLLPVALLLPALLLAGCDAIVDRDRRSMPAIPLAPATEAEAREETQEEESFIRFERNTGYDGSVLIIFGDPDPDKPNARPELTTARNALDRGEPFRPNMPEHSGWRWNLLNLGQDGTTYAYAAISWHDDDPMDYLAAGYWFHYPHPLPGPDAEGIDAAGFVDGPELDPETAAQSAPGRPGDLPGIRRRYLFLPVRPGVGRRTGRNLRLRGIHRHRYPDGRLRGRHRRRLHRLRRRRRHQPPVAS